MFGLLEFTKEVKLCIALAVVCLTLVIFVINFFVRKYCSKVYLLDFACYKPQPSQSCTKEMVLHLAKLSGKFTDTSLDFMQKIMYKSGLGQSTYLPESLLKQPATNHLEEAIMESKSVMFGAVDELLAKTGVQGKGIGIVIVNSSLLNVVPSLSAMIVNRYNLRENVVSYNLAGMGCSAGLAAIGLASRLLQVHRNSLALVVSTENITQNVYMGCDRSMILTNCIFRVGGAAILLSNRTADRNMAKYQLIHTVQAHTAYSDRSYNCIYQQDDHQGNVGIIITKDIMIVAIKTIKANLTVLGRLILPVSEKLLYVINFIIRYFYGRKIELYVPQFMRAVDHVFTHVGGKPVLDELERSLKLNENDMEASRMTLYRFGNTSSSSVWYGLAYAEAKGRIKSGDRLWQIAFGSGFKCISLIWKAMRTVDLEENNPWRDEIDKFPVDLKHMDALQYKFEPSKDM